MLSHQRKRVEPSYLSNYCSLSLHSAQAPSTKRVEPGRQNVYCSLKPRANSPMPLSLAESTKIAVYIVNHATLQHYKILCTIIAEKIKNFKTFRKISKFAEKTQKANTLT